MKKLTFILLLFVISLNSFGQFDITKRKITLDSLKARNDSIYVLSPMTGDVAKFNTYIGAASVAGSTQGEIQYYQTPGILGASPNFTWNDTTLIVNPNVSLGNLFIGANAGIVTTSSNNTFLGNSSGKSNLSGNNNTFIGYNAGIDNTGGTANTFIGSDAGNDNTSGQKNVIIGNQAGFNNNGNANIILGYQAAYLESSLANTLWLENSSNATPLIYGEFDNDILVFNTDTTINKGHLVVDSNLYVHGVLIDTRYGVAAYVPSDSTLTTTVTTAWAFVGDGDNKKFVSLISNGFTYDQDTAVFNKDIADKRDSVLFMIDWSTSSTCSSNNEIIYYGVFIKSVGEVDYTEVDQFTRDNDLRTSDDDYSWACTSMPFWMHEGDKIQVRAKCGGGTTLLTTTAFGINLREP